MANLSDPGHGPLILSVTWVLTALALILIATRFYVRVNILHALGADDWVMLLAGVLLIVFQACITKGYLWGLGKHDVDLTTEQLINILKWDWISTTPSILVSIVARISITILLIRLFGNKLWFRRFLIICTGFQSIVAIIVIVVVWAQCRPVQGLWNPTIPASRLNPAVQQDLAYLAQSLFTFSDLTYVAIPVWIIWNLNMSLRKRVGLVSIMSVGLFTMAASIMKTVTSQSHAKAADSEYNASVSILWSAIEQCLVIIMGCAPPLRAVSKIQFSKLRSLSQSLVRLVDSARTKRERSSSGFHSSSERSAYQDIELGDSRKQSRKQNTPLYEAKNFAVAGTCTKDANSHEHGEIQKIDAFSVSYDQPKEPKAIL